MRGEQRGGGGQRAWSASGALRRPPPRHTNVGDDNDDDDTRRSAAHQLAQQPQRHADTLQSGFASASAAIAVSDSDSLASIGGEDIRDSQQPVEQSAANINQTSRPQPTTTKTTNRAPIRSVTTPSGQECVVVCEDEEPDEGSWRKSLARPTLQAALDVSGGGSKEIQHDSFESSSLASIDRVSSDLEQREKEADSFEEELDSLQVADRVDKGARRRPLSAHDTRREPNAARRQRSASTEARRSQAVEVAERSWHFDGEEEQEEGEEEEEEAPYLSSGSVATKKVITGRAGWWPKRAERRSSLSGSPSSLASSLRAQQADRSTSSLFELRQQQQPSRQQETHTASNTSWLQRQRQRLSRAARVNQKQQQQALLSPSQTTSSSGIGQSVSQKQPQKQSTQQRPNYNSNLVLPTRGESLQDFSSYFHQQRSPTPASYYYYPASEQAHHHHHHIDRKNSHFRSSAQSLLSATSTTNTNNNNYYNNRRRLRPSPFSTSSIFALYALRYAYDKFHLALRAFHQWYRDNLAYNKLSHRMEFDKQRFERWFTNKGRPLSLRTLDHYDQLVIWIADERDNIQKRTFTKWINKYLLRRGKQMQDLFDDLRDGQNLITLLEMLSGEQLPRERGRMRVHKLQNIQIALNYIKLRKVKLVNIRPEDIVDGNQKLTLGLIWTIILHFQLEDNSNFREILLRWAQKTTDGYPGCNVTDLTTSWRDGLAFNAILHRNRPDLLNYRECRKKTSRENLEQAFSVAERDLDVARLLEPEDVDVPCPDEKSMITYLAQLYELFPDPPERNPLLDEEKIRRIDEYKQLASELLKWIKHSTRELDKRDFPRAIAELQKLKEATEQFKRVEVPPKEHDKNRLANVAQDIYKMAADVNVRIPDDLHTDNIEFHWDRMLKALGNRSRALDDELAKAKRLKELLEKLLDDIKKANGRLDGIEGRINDEERKVARLSSLRDADASGSPQAFQRISEDLADVGIKLDTIKRLAEEFCQANGRTEPDSIMIREKVAELDGRYKKLLGRLNRLGDEFERTLKRLREQNDAERRAQAQREAEQKLRLRLQEMKRKLDELEYRIDHMDPVAKDLAQLQRQLAELHEFDKDLKKAGQELRDLKAFAEKLIADDLLIDPARARMEIGELEAQLARIEDKAARRLQLFERALEHAEKQKKAEQEINLKLDGIRREIEELEKRMDRLEAEPVGKDLATLKRQLEELKAFEGDVNRTRQHLNDVVRLAEDMIREDLIAEPAKLRKNINELKDRLAQLDERVAKRLRALKEGLNRAEAQKEAQEKFQLRLDAMKRELDELERRLDQMAPVARDLGTLQQQLQEMHEFGERLAKAGEQLDELVKAGERLISEDLIADPEALRKNLKGLKEQFKRIQDKAAQRLKAIQDAMSGVAASDAIGEVAKWLQRAKKVLVDEEQVHGDLDTVNALIEQHKSFEAELQARQPAIAEVRRMEADLSRQAPETGKAVREQLQDLSNQWRDVERLIREKSAKLEDALRSAEQLHANVHGLLEWLAEAEMKLRFSGSMPEDEQSAKQELGEHEKFLRKLASQAQHKDQTVKLARDILAKCHPDAEPVLNHWINIIGSRWDEIEAWAKKRGQKLADHLRSLGELLELVEELIQWLSRHETRLLGEETHELPVNAHQLESMIDAHAQFMEELRKREPDVDRVVKIFASKSSQATSKTIVTASTVKPRQGDASTTTTGTMGSRAGSSGRLSSSGARSATPTSGGASRTSYATYRDEYPEVRHARARVMLEKWRNIWQLSLDKMQRLKDKVEQLREMERLENFDFDQWRRRFLTWVNSNKGRVTDFFRSIDDDNDGRVPLEAFISGVLRSKFDTSRLEMERVAEVFDRNNDGTIDNKEYLDSLRPDKPITDDELIQDEVQRQVARCTCAQRYRVYHVGEGRYRFGESQKLRLVRILRSTVMVRVGGGWEPLTSFLQKNDPCRAKGRTNVELREQFILPEGASQAMAAFKSRLQRDPGSMPVLGPITKIREKTDRSIPMGGSHWGGGSSSRHGSPSDYYSESEQSRARSRLTATSGRLTPNSGAAGSRPSSRHGSDISPQQSQQSLDAPAATGAHSRRPTSRSTDNLR